MAGSGRESGRKGAGGRKGGAGVSGRIGFGNVETENVPAPGRYRPIGQTRPPGSRKVKTKTGKIDSLILKRVLDAARESENYRDIVPAPTPKQAMFLCAVAELGQDAYGVQIAVWMGNQLGGRVVNPGQVYGIAAEMVRDGLVAENKLPSPHGRGRPIIVYRLTPVGEKTIVALGLVLEAGYQRPTVPGRWAKAAE